MTSIVLITNGSRPRLLEQTLRTLYGNTPADQFNLTLVIENSAIDFGTPLWDALNSFNHINGSMLMLDPACHILGRLKNLGAYWSERHFGRGEWLYFSDDDVVFKDGWLPWMTGAMYHSENGRTRFIGTEQRADALKILGGCQHPYHRTNRQIGVSSWGRINVTDAVAGYSLLMRWNTFDKYGPFDAHAKGVCQSEDFALCRKVVEDGFDVGYSECPHILHCGITNAEGKPAIGSEQIVRVPGILYE